MKGGLAKEGKNVSLNKFSRPLIPDAIYQESGLKLSCFWSRRCLNAFTIYWHGGHLV